MDEIDIRHTEIGLDQGILEQSHDLTHAVTAVVLTADAKDEESGLPKELGHESYDENTNERNFFVFLFLQEIVDDGKDITDDHDKSHDAVIFSRPASRHESQGRRGEIIDEIRHQRTAYPPDHDQKRILDPMFVVGHPQPDEGEIEDAVAHGHPEENPGRPARAQ